MTDFRTPVRYEDFERVCNEKAELTRQNKILRHHLMEAWLTLLDKKIITEFSYESWLKQLDEALKSCNGGVE